MGRSPSRGGSGIELDLTSPKSPAVSCPVLCLVIFKNFILVCNVKQRVRRNLEKIKTMVQQVVKQIQTLRSH